MPYSKLSTSKIARAVGCHPNTVRLYEKWGFLPQIPRSLTGYRLYTQEHQDQMQLAWLAFNAPFPGRKLRISAARLVRMAASGDLGGALEAAYLHLALVQAELAQSESAAAMLEHWAQGAPTETSSQQLRIGATSALLNLTADTLRNWESNGLLRVPREPETGYRRYGKEQIARLRVIRMLRSAGYSILAILRMLLKLDRGEASDLRLALDTPPADDEIQSAADRWVSTLKDHEERARRMIAMIEKRMAKPST